MEVRKAYTIGFTKRSAEQFFETLKLFRIKQLIDIRLNNTSQLACFAKRDDLQFFLKEICSAEYIHKPILSPTKDILDEFKKKEISWEEYEKRFLELLEERKIEEIIDRKLFENPTVLLCSESSAENCHRRLVAEYLKNLWSDIKIIHL